MFFVNISETIHATVLSPGLFLRGHPELFCHAKLLDVVNGITSVYD